VVAPTVDGASAKQCASYAGKGADWARDPAQQIGGVAGGGGDGRTEVFRAKFLPASAADTAGAEQERGQ
jgi:hypothetical protein